MDNSPKPEMLPGDYITEMNEAANYMLTLGASFFLNSHIEFIGEYIEECRKAGIDRLSVTASTRFWRIRLLPAMLRGVFTSVAGSVYKMMTGNLHSIPPLITSLVVVFVTSDAWRLLGGGFTARLITLWFAFIIASLFFLGHRDYWKDIEKSGSTEADREHAAEDCPAFDDFISKGARPSLRKPEDRVARVYACINYWLLSFLSLLGVAIIVTVALLVIGMILIDTDKTRALAGASSTYIPLPGHGALTGQLLSLSLILGSFAALFLVAGQRPEDRKTFMTAVLRPIRLALIAYSVYCQARENSKEWTRVCLPSLKELRRGSHPNRLGGFSAGEPGGGVGR